MGSLASRAEDDTFDETASDIDVAIAVDPSLLPLDHERYPHGKFLVHEGCAIQAILVPSPVFEDDEALLTMLGLGCNLRHGHILSDPQGKLAVAQELVIARWAEPAARARRVERAETFATRAVERLHLARDVLARLNALCEVVTQLAGIVAIANCTTPTHRRALAVAGPLFAERGRSDLFERLLSAIGAEHPDEPKLLAATSDAVAAADLEVRIGTGADMTAEFRSLLPQFVEGGIRDMVEHGNSREALLPALTSVGLSGAAVWDVASAPDRSEVEGLARRALRYADVPPGGWESRAGELQHLAADVMAAVRER